MHMDANAFWALLCLVINGVYLGFQTPGYYWSFSEEIYVNSYLTWNFSPV